MFKNDNAAEDRTAALNTKPNIHWTPSMNGNSNNSNIASLNEKIWKYNITSIGQNVFSDTDMKVLANEKAYEDNTTFVGEKSDKDNTTSVGEESDKDNTTSVAETSDKYNTTCVGETSDKDNITSVGETSFKDNTTSVGETSFKDNTTSVGEKSGKDSTTSVGETSFKDNTTSVGEKSGKDSTTSVGETSFKDNTTSVGETSFKDNTTSVGETSFKDNTTSVGETSFKDNTTSVGETSFKDNTTSVGETSFKDNTTSVGETSFKDNTTSVGEKSGKDNTTSVGETSFKDNTISVGEKSGKDNTTSVGETSFKDNTTSVGEKSGKDSTTSVGETSFKDNITSNDESVSSPLRLSERPERPLDSDCCGNGCSPCVMDIYYEELALWEAGLSHGESTLGKRVNDQIVTVLHPSQYVSYPILDIKQEAIDSVRIRCGLASNQRLGLSLGQHIIVRSQVPGSSLTRQFTPVSPLDAKGYFELLIKIYPGGRMSQRVQSWKVGDMLEARGPAGHLDYVRNKFHHILMLCAGSGIAPMCSVIGSILGDDDEEAYLRLVYACHSYSHLMAKTEIDEWMRFWNFSCMLALSQEPDNPDYRYRSGVDVYRGRIDKNIVGRELRSNIDNTLVLVCGTRSFDTDMMAFLKELGVPERNIHKY